MKESFGYIGGFLMMLVFLAFGAAQLFAGFIGIEQYLSPAWAWTALIIAIIFRFMLPLTIGSFYTAMYIWGWHWALATLFVLPGLLFVIPGIFAFFFSSIKLRKAAE